MRNAIGFSKGLDVDKWNMGAMYIISNSDSDEETMEQQAGFMKSLEKYF